MVESLRSRAFLCLNNLVQALPVDDLGGSGIRCLEFEFFPKFSFLARMGTDFGTVLQLT